MTHGEISTREDFFRSSPNQHHDLNRRGCSEKIFFSRFAGSPLRGNFLRCSRKKSRQNKKTTTVFETRDGSRTFLANINTDIGAPFEKHLRDGVEGLLLRLNVR